MVTPSRVSCTRPDTLSASATISPACSASLRVQVRRRGLGPEPLAQLGDVAQPAADSLELLVDVDCLASPAEHGRQVRLALLLEPLHHHEPLHGALDEVLGAADLTGGLLVLVVVLRHLLAHELVAEPLAVHLADHASERGSTSRNSCSVIVAPHSWATISGLFSLNSPLSPSQWIPSLCFLSVSRSRP